MTDETRNQAIGGVAGGVAGYAVGKAATGAVTKMVTGKMVGTVVGRVLGSVVGSVVPIAGTLVGGAVGAAIGDKLGDVIANTFFGGETAQVVPEPRAAGGPVAAGKPYLVGERGPELMVPKGSGDILNNNKTMAQANKLFNSTDNALSNDKIMAASKKLLNAAARGNQSYADIAKQLDSQELLIDNMGKSYDVMTKDVKIQEEQISKDTKQQKTFSLKNNRLITLKSKLMDEEITLLEEQNDLLEKMVEHAERLGGKEAGANVRKMFQMTRALGQQGAQATMAMGGGGGAGGMPGAPGGVGAPGNFQFGPQTQAGGPPATPAMGGGGGATSVPTGPQPNYGAEAQSTGGTSAQQQQPSPGQQGKPRKKTDGVIYHHTGGRSLSGAMSTLQARGLGYHYLIGRDGSLHPYYPDNTVAYHAGPTDKNPGVGNWNTIGVAALANDNNDLTKEQLDAAIKLNQMLSSKYGFSSSNVFGHGAVTSRKNAEEGAMMVKAIKSGMSELPSAQKGGVVSGPDSGFLAELHGQEAVVPLPDGKSIPVALDIKQTAAPNNQAQIIKLDLKDVLGPNGIGPTFAGYNQYTGYNMGPMTTDLEVVKEIGASMGAFDKATQTITDPNTWKEILSSGIATNYQLGMMEVGTKMIPNIGQEMGQRISEIVSEKGVDQKEAFQVMTQEFRTAMQTVIKAVSKDTEESKGPDFAALAEGIRELVSKQSEANDISKKILSVSQ